MKDYLVNRLKEKLLETELVLDRFSFDQDEIFYKFKHKVDLFLPTKRLIIDIHETPVSHDGRTYYNTRMADAYLQSFNMIEFVQKRVIEEFDSVVEEIRSYVGVFNNSYVKGDKPKRNYSKWSRV